MYFPQLKENVVLLDTGKRKFYFSAENEAEMNQWYNAIKECITADENVIKECRIEEKANLNGRMAPRAAWKCGSLSGILQDFDFPPFEITPEAVSKAPHGVAASLFEPNDEELSLTDEQLEI